MKTSGADVRGFIFHPTCFCLRCLPFPSCEVKAKRCVEKNEDSWCSTAQLHFFAAIFMPIALPIETRRISQAEFAEISYEVMNHVFAIHNEFGRLFAEKIYKRELMARMEGIALEVPIVVSHDTFVKTYFLDVLVHAAGLFEFKSAEAIHPRHRCQTTNYLLLADLAHAKIANVRPELVEHDFVNCNQRRIDLREPTFLDDKWDSRADGAEKFRSVLKEAHDLIG